jgi:large subunit ribosomal protein L25
MENPVLEAKRRSVIGKQVKAIRRQGQLPAIMYGAGTDPTPIVLDGLEATRVLSGTGGSTLIELKVDDASHFVLVREIQRHVILHNLEHVDFLKVAMDELISAEVPIELVGHAPAVREHGGVLVSGLSTIEVEALPGDLMDRLSIDLSVLAEIEDAITVGDLELPAGVKVLTDPEELIARVIYQVEEIEEEEEGELLEEFLADDAEPELIERGRRDDESEDED